MEEDDTDSDRTVLLRDFISKPQKVELKRRRLSELQERGKKPDQSNNENTTPSNVSNNQQFDVPKNNSVGKNWLLTRYFSSIGKPFGAKTLNNASDIQQSDNLRENMPKYAPDSQVLNKNTPKSDNDIICLDSDEDIDETLRSENPQNQETNGEVSSHVTKLKVLKPSAINARRATTIVFETQNMQENEPARLKVLKPSMINARRATTNFEDNVEYNSSNGKENVEREHVNVSNNDNKQVDKDGLRISCRLSPSESNIRNITNSPSSGTNTGTCATQGEDNRTSVVTVANNMSNTDTSDTTIVGKLFQQDAEKNTVSNVKANKRFSNNETKMDSKRIKMNVEPECLIKQHEQVTNKKSQEIAEISESHGEHVSHEEIMNLTNNPARCNENTVNKSIVNSVREESKLKEHVLPGIQDSRKIEDEHVINEAHINVQTSNKELGKQDARNAKNCNPRVEQGSKMQENRDVNKIEDTLNTSKDRVHANDSDAASKVQNQQYSDIHKTSTIQDVITTNEIQVKQKSTNQVHNPTVSKIHKDQDTSQTIETPNKVNIELETFKDQETTNEVLNANESLKILNKDIVSTTNEVQGPVQVQSELETSKQIVNNACVTQELNTLYEEQRTIKTLNREDKEEETRKVTNASTTIESHSDQGTDQKDKTPANESLRVGAENKRVLQFQILFLKVILENLINHRYPESGKTLKNIIKTLVINARNGKFQSHVQYACPECGCLSNYSSSLLDNTKSGADALSIDSSQQCGLCRGVREIHTAYLVKIANKKGHIGNKREDVDNDSAKQLVEQSDKTLTQETSRNSKTISEDSNVKDSVTRSVVEDRSFGAAADKDTNTENISLTQIDREIQNHNALNEHNITNEAPPINASDPAKITKSCMNNISFANELKISNKRTNEIDEQFIINKRMKTATENKNTQSEENLKTNDDSSDITTCQQSDNSTIENNKERNQPLQRNSNTTVERPDTRNVTPNIDSSHEINKTSHSQKDDSPNPVNPVEVKHTSDAECNRDLRPENNGHKTAENAQIEAVTETDLNIPSTNTRITFLHHQSQSNDIILAKSDQSSAKTDDNTNSVANEISIDSTSQNVSSVEVEGNDGRIENVCNKSTSAAAQICNEVHKQIESIIEPMVESLQSNKNASEEEKNHSIVQEKDKSLQNFAPNEHFNLNKFINGSTIAIKYICPMCTSTYTHPSKFLRHLKNKYNLRLSQIPETYIKQQCPFCNYLLNKKSYNRHIARCRSDIHRNNQVKKNDKDQSKVTNEETRNNGKTGQINSSELKYKYRCSVCNETLATNHAAVRHRTQLHPELKNRHIIKKIRIEMKINSEQIDNRKELVTKNVDNANTNSESVGGESETMSSTTINNQKTTQSTKKRKPSTDSDMSYNEDEESSYSDESLSSGDNSNKTSESSDEEDDEKKDRNKTKKFHASKDTSADNTHRRDKRSTITYACELCHQKFYSDYAARKHRFNQHPDMVGRPLYKKIKNVESVGNTSTSKAESKRLLEKNTSSSSTNRDHENEQKIHTRRGNGRERCIRSKNESTSDSDWSTVSNSDCCDEKSAKKSRKSKRRTKHTKITSEDEITNASDYSDRRRKKRFGTARRNSRVTVTENSESEECSSDSIVSTEESSNSSDENEYCHSQDTSTHESQDPDYEIDDNSDNGGTDVEQSNDDSNLSTDEEVPPVSNNETADISIRRINKKKQRLLKLPNDSTDTDEEDGEIMSPLTVEIPSDDELIKVSENTLKKRKERMSTLFDENNEISVQNTHENDQDQSKETNDTTNHTAPIVEKSGNERIDMNIVNKENDISDLQLHDNDRHEIDMIDCLLEEYNTRDDQTASCADKVKDGKDTDNHNNQPEVNIDEQSLVSTDIRNCLENIQISNVRSIERQRKLYIYVCSECSYATDTYDDTIRHSQNHYNQIEDPVTYCDICQIQYDSSCFERHEISHDKYLIHTKVKFSYHWLFSNWQAVFDNDQILLSDAEEMQVQSVYKTQCVKMTIKEDGPWQSALYLCAKCNIFVPPSDIEKHLQQNCIQEYFPCDICQRAFLSKEMREHHKIYHTDEIAQPFKTIVFNEKKYEVFNSKLIEAKLQVTQNKEEQRYVDVYKCICGLCFITLKQFKLHFVDCESKTNDGVQCTKCSSIRRFLPSDLMTHMSLHHSTKQYEFKVHQIIFQVEREHESSGLSAALDITSDIINEDLNTKQIMLKHETLSQHSQNIVEDSEMLSSLENAVQQMTIDTDSNINREVMKDELLSQNTNNSIDIEEENLNIRRTNANEHNSTQQSDITERNSESRGKEENVANKSSTDNATQGTCNAADLNIKRDMLKDEVSSQNTIDEIQECTQVFQEHLDTIGAEKFTAIDEDLNIKKEMLKHECFSQNTNQVNSQSQDIEDNSVNKTVTDDATHINSNDADLIVKRELLKGEILSQNIFEEDTQENTEISEENRRSTSAHQDHNIKENMSKNESTTQNTNIDNKQGENDIVEIGTKITQKATVKDNLNVVTNTLGDKENLESENTTTENVESERESPNILTNNVVVTEGVIVIDSDDDVEIVEELNDQRFVRSRAYPGGNHWDNILTAFFYNSNL